MKLTLNMTLNSDYHIGAGFGIGSTVDSALLRDQDRVPVVRGSTIEGLFRDGLWRLLQTQAMRKALQNDDLCKAAQSGGKYGEFCKDKAPCPFCATLGTPALPKQWRFSSARPIGADKQFGETREWRNGNVDANVVARNTLSLKTRRTDSGKLFSQEEGSKRLEFKFNIVFSDRAIKKKKSNSSVPASDSTGADAPQNPIKESIRQAALLVAAARMVRRFGSTRRRGRGECQIKLVAVDGWPVTNETESADWQALLLDYFKKSWLQKEQIEAPENVAKTWTAPKGQSTNTKFRLVARTDEPVVCASQAESGNFFESVEYITGANVLGALAHRANNKWDLSNDKIYRVFLNLFRQGKAKFSPLYPTVHSGRLYATIPIPFDILTCKVHPGIGHDHHQQTPNFATVSTLPDECEKCKNDIPLVHKSGFVGVRDGLREVEVQMREEMHPRIHPQTQKAARGELFGFKAIEAGQYFMGEMTCTDPETWSALCQMCEVTEQQTLHLRLGKAVRRGYGAVTAWIEPIADGIDQWRGMGLDKRVLRNNDFLTMTFLTDTIIQDAWGRSLTSFCLESLEQMLGFKVDAEIHQFCKSKPIDGFNNYLGLPRWRDIALQAGSTVGFKPAEPQISLDDLIERLQELEREGIGLRRNEGFGVVAFNHPVYNRGNNIPMQTGMRIPSDLKLVDKAEQQTEQIESDSRFIQIEWAEILREKDTFDPENFEHKKWDAVARWLWRGRAMPIAELKQELDNFGKTENLTDIDRGKDNQYYGEKNAKRAMQQINCLLEKLADKSEFVRSKAIQMLADRISLAARKEAQQ